MIGIDAVTHIRYIANMKKIPGFNNYIVDKEGKIYSLISNKIMTPMKNKSGHLYIIARVNKKGKKLFVHRAVLLAFRGEAPIGEETRHLDGNPNNNNISNLKWGTRLENMLDKKAHGNQSYGEKHPSAKLTEKNVIEIRERIKKETARSLGKTYGVSHTAIIRAAKHIKWKYLK